MSLAAKLRGRDACACRGHAHDRIEMWSNLTLRGSGALAGALAVDASWLDATAMDGGVACGCGSLLCAHCSAYGLGYGMSGVVDAAGATTTHVVIESMDAKEPAGVTKPGADENPNVVPPIEVYLVPVPEADPRPVVKPENNQDDFHYSCRFEAGRAQGRCEAS